MLFFSGRFDRVAVKRISCGSKPEYASTPAVSGHHNRPAVAAEMIHAIGSVWHPGIGTVGHV